MSARAPVLALALAFLVSLSGGGSADARGTGAKKSPSRTSSAKSSTGKKPSASSSSSSSKRLAKSERGRGKRHDKRRRYYAPPQMPQTLELLDLDLVTGFAHVVAVGTTRVPDARLFVLTDDRGRRFVPEQAECAAPPGVNVPPEALQPDEPGADEGGGEAPSDRPAGPSAAPVHEATAGGGLAPINTRWRCTLTIARLYRRARLVAVSMEWGQKAVDVPRRMVDAVWKKAAAAAPDVAVAQTAPAREAVRPPPSPLPPEDAPEEEGPAEPTRDVGATVE